MLEARLGEQAARERVVLSAPRSPSSLDGTVTVGSLQGCREDRKGHVAETPAAVPGTWEVSKYLSDN